MTCQTLKRGGPDTLLSDQMINQQEALRLLGICRETFVKIPGRPDAVKMGRLRMYRWGDLQEWMNKHRVTG